MAAVLKPRTTTVVLFQGDDLDPIRDRADEVEKVIRSAAPARVGDTTDEVAVAAKSFDDFMEEANERAVKIVLAALGRKRYRELLNEHPPRMVPNDEGVPEPRAEDAALGFNRETFGDDLVPECMGEAFGTREECDAFLDGLSDGDFSKLYNAALNLNQSPGADPKLRLSLHVAPTSDETSTSQDRLA